jgi:hypothetical protein
MSKQNLNLATITLFFLVLLTPFLGGVLGADKTPQANENRNLATLPTFNDYWNYLKKYQSYFDDHSTFRGFMVKADHQFKIDFLNISPNPGVALGKNDWLFYVPDDTLIDTLNGHPFTSTELSEIKKNLETTQKHFESQGIKYYFLVAPNSQTIYPEFLPANFQKANPASRLEQISKLLQETNSPASFINPVNDLKNSKNKSQLYRKFDTHWNDYGAFIAYTTLMTKISQDFPNLKPYPINDFNIQYSPSKYKDLELLLGLTGNYNEPEPYFSSKKPTPTLLTESCSKPYEQCAEVIYQKQNSNEPKLVMYRDSFGVSLIPFIANHFSNSQFYWKVIPHSVEEVTQEKPDIIIVELTERELWRLPDKLFSF